ncbi:hypothetical protein PGT21_026933 [Puccinia graminis f. sp. tritici]|uniref:Uncharacterized protein n=1 Tax=Puccinia graminis f. sp. tritici TaxID=56615 RepID=A0A5B0NDE7_PUCGR|nr:hypothetical protein PGT21_026933 [Puccinia graminis f. sp. tritici]
MSKEDSIPRPPVLNHITKRSSFRLSLPLPFFQDGKPTPGKRLPYITAEAKAQYIRELFDRALPRPGVTSSLVRHPRVHMFVRRHTPLPFTPLRHSPKVETKALKGGGLSSGAGLVCQTALAGTGERGAP